ncbi:threonine/serine exporter ThrE family protein [Anatilimnocola sp. NA78]|uniref:threonine/serine ThrE exporter family protein n=1 Tax=Anatilimnocola sp. NA78 TaxID=3415683 RepID=UPI003CE4C403
MAQPPATVEAKALLEFLFRLGQAYLASGEQTAQVELLLRRVATAYKARRSRVVVFPTAIFISVSEGEDDRIAIADGPSRDLRLDQIADVYDLGNTALTAGITPREGVERLAAIMRTSPRFGAIGSVVGHAILAVGVAMILASAFTNMMVAALLGAGIGALKLLNKDRPVLAVPLPVISAALVSAFVYLAVKYDLPVVPIHALVPPLVSFLPGAMLSLGMVELVYGDMVSGSSRLTTGFVHLMLLAFGLVAGAALVGVSSDSLIEASDQVQIPWVQWLGVIVFGIGVFFHFSAPRNSFWWMQLVLVLTFAAQQLGAAVLGKEISGFFGMLVATPLGYLIQLRFKGPPAMVTFLPCFWLLVPGSLGLLSVTRMLSDRAAGVDGLVSTLFIFISLALGSLMGASLYKWLSERFGGWRLLIGRANSPLKHRRKR